MNDLMVGLIGMVSGAVASVLTTATTHWIDRRRQDQFTVRKYARPIWLACHQLKHRLEQIVRKLKDPRGNAAEVLNWRNIGESKNIEWMNGHGYYITSTAYLLSSLSCWFHIVDREVVFLPFSDKSKAAEFYNLVKQVKIDLTTKTPLWFHYYGGLGQMLLDEAQGQPITFGQFVTRLCNDEVFRRYFHQMFNEFLHVAGEGQITGQLEDSISSLDQVQRYLEANATVPVRSMAVNQE